MRTQLDTTTLEMAIMGYRSELGQIEAKMSEIRRRLGGARAVKGEGGGGDVPTAFRAKRILSAAVRKRIAQAQKKRWAAFHAQSERRAGKAPSKRTLSPEAKAKIVANLAKARAARAAKAFKAEA